MALPERGELLDADVLSYSELTDLFELSTCYVTGVYARNFAAERVIALRTQD